MFLRHELLYFFLLLSFKQTWWTTGIFGLACLHVSLCIVTYIQTSVQAVIAGEMKPCFGKGPFHPPAESTASHVNL